MKAKELRQLVKNFVRLNYHHHSKVNVDIISAVKKVKKTPSRSNNSLKTVALKSLKRYHLEVKKLCIIRGSQNIIYRVDTKGAKYMLRIHSPNKDTNSLMSEMLWLAALRRDLDLAVPEPIISKDGKFIQEVSLLSEEGIYKVVLFKWIEGNHLGSNVNFHRMKLLGEFIANLHQHSEQFSNTQKSIPKHFDWEEDISVWFDQSNNLKIFKPKGVDLCRSTAIILLEELNQFDWKQEFCLIHKDLHPWNCLLSGNRLAVIDFECCSYGPFVYDLASALYSTYQYKDTHILRKGLLEGYSQIKSLPFSDKKTLDMFIVLISYGIIHWLLNLPNLYEKIWSLQNLAKALTILERYKKHRIL